MHEWPSTLDVGELMAGGWRPTPFRQFILKIHSRCDLACAYCYMYEMADTSWRGRPKRMTPETFAATAARIAEHTRTHGLTEIEVVLHGGEPLLAGREAIRDLVTRIRSAVGGGTRVRVALQTNATLLDHGYLDLFAELDLRVGVSLDGDGAMHDRSRRRANGQGSHAAVVKALGLLTSPAYRHLFSGLLCTVDLRNDPLGAYEALLAFGPPAVDFLLPHGNWSAPPPGRDPGAGATPYADWLIPVFDRWYRSPRQPTRVRLFDEIVHLLLGGASASEAVGLSPAAMVVVETDGGIEQSDFLKSAYQGAPETGLHVARDSFDDVLLLPAVAARQIGELALSAACRRCPVGRVCGGGLYAHRYREGNGFANPSVYCPDLLRLIEHVKHTVEADLSARIRAHRRSRPVGTDQGTPMELREHRIPAEVLSALAGGGGGAAVVARLAAAQRSKHVLLVHEVMRSARVTGHPRATVARRAYDLLAAVQQRHPEAVETVLRHPSVGAWARHTVMALRRGDEEARPEQLAALAAAAAIRSGTVCEIDVPAVEGVVTLPSLGQAVLSPTLSEATVQCFADGADVMADGLVVGSLGTPDDAPGWRGLRTLSVNTDGSPFHVTVDDLDPYRMPGTANMGGRLSSAEVERWQATLTGAWRLLVRHHRSVADEVRAAISVLTPLNAPPQGQSSASSRETFGSVALSAQPDATTFAVTLTHEMQHAKLSALLDIVPLTGPDDGSRHYAPWRPDPRPVPGLLQGAYAYMGVTDFWRRQLRVDSGAAALEAGAEFFRWRAAARLVCGTILGSGRLTPSGELFVTTMARRLDDWSQVAVPAAARALGRERADRHRALWVERNG
ncbi:FxsB family radical SAM/SPASM domain protein [Planomonospora sp. ID91781]|uniref:FxsB family cyclophane-forming radical SAM/SPASM peptide maturase n=1 Tax=Planomonospora sp. ID91781 TaxID=2738135 RepID=UPI0018C40C48|nr:FxsB family cyclophane-forming radical SAM/SPASM peptide maturase [Planomonospora sp. ID91781]MBG0822805.1 FxsB family radical SAM/SPASM domain protein [Planomonospora sp. ID91781]